MAKNITFKGTVKKFVNYVYTILNHETNTEIDLKINKKFEKKLNVGEDYLIHYNEIWLNDAEPISAQKSAVSIQNPIDKEKVSETAFKIPDLNNPEDRRTFNILFCNFNNTIATLRQHDKDYTIEMLITERDKLLKDYLERFWR